MTINLHQNIEQVRFSVHDSPGGENRSLVLHGDRVFVEYSVLRDATGLVGGKPLPDVPGVMTSEANPNGVFINGTTVDTADPFGQRTYYWGYEYGDGTGGPGYDRAGPYNHGDHADTDNSLHGTRNLTCAPGGDRTDCHATVRGLTDNVAGLTPNIQFGMAWDAVVVGVGDARHVAAAARSEGNATGRVPSSARDTGSSKSEGPAAFDDLIYSYDPDRDSSVEERSSPPPTRVLSDIELARLHPPLALPSFLFIVGGLALSLIAGALYSRLRSAQEIRESPSRRALFDLVSESPGLDLAELTRRSGFARTAVVHHVRLLVRANAVVIRAEGHRRRIFAYGSMPGEFPVDRASAAGRVLELLRARRMSVTIADLDDALKLPIRTRNHALRVLSQKGLVSRTGSQLRLDSARAE